MPATTATIEERVQRGALLLDAEIPGWAERINERELDLGSCDNCILGQVYGFYYQGLICLNLNGGRAAAHGFAARLVECPALAAAWLAEIRLRLAPDDEPAPALAGIAAGRDNAPEDVP